MLKIDERGAVSPQIYSALRQAIITMALKPGQALSEKEIALSFGSSRQPVREAFIKLAEAGLVRVLPQRGTYVVKVSPKQVADARFVREAVEVAVARHCCLSAGKPAIDALERIVAEQESAAAADDHAGFLALDEAFHKGLAEAIGCSEAWRVIEMGKAQMDRVRYLSLPEASPMSLLIDQHRAILAAIRAGDADRAAAAVRIHLREILVSLPRLAEAYPELFEDEDLPGHAADLQVGVREDASETRSPK
ncbi:GntR family transcriptional regulator [Jiella endophytica]|uniref:GntR family transcriptional regulator n=1 Tax=Jiella endophytica TaxID=2558362 RepID=A0A4Y8RNY3_9HYPH|nr:GntR family transcriptional regulator [Jiella endophytica]TFF25373.1 GntR family transcriptional regulator [Jiella endophytica]